MSDTKVCEQCGTSFAPRREHARFCSARCRVAWNRHNASDPPAETGALDWSITAMRETTGRLLKATDWDRANGFAVISEAVWWVTMVDATLMRYHPDIHGRVLAGQDAGQCRMTEDTFAGLRFVRNRMGYDTDPGDFIQPLASRPGAGRIAAWTWRPVPEPALGSLTPGAREWEMTRYRAYQAQLAGQPVGATFRRATAFLRLAAEGTASAAPSRTSTGADYLVTNLIHSVPLSCDEPAQKSRERWVAGLAESACWSWRVSMVFRTKRAKVLAVGTVAGVAAALTVGLSAPSGATPVASHGSGGNHVRLDRVFIIVLENHSAKSVIGDPNTPYITSLAQRYGEAANYFGVTHPSEPNYIAMTSGSNWFTNNDNPANRFDHTNVVDTLEAAHISWDAYMEALPADPLADFWPSSAQPLYASKHNPFALYTDVRDNPARVAHIKPYTALAGDLNRGHAPRFVYITPDQCNDMHGGVTATIDGHPETPCPFNSTNDDPNDIRLKHNADAFVKTAVTTIMSSRAWTRHSAIFIVADEGDFTGNAVNGGWDSPAGCCDSPVLPAGDPDISASWPGGLYGGALVPAVVIDPSGPHHFVSNVAYNHYSMLRTIEDAWGLPELAFTSDHAQVSTMNEFLAH